MSHATPPFDPASPESPPPPPEPRPTPMLERLEARVVTYWLVSGMLFFAVLCGLGYYGWTWIDQEAAATSQRLLPVALTLAALLLVWTLIAPPLSYWRWRFAITEQLLVLRHGILFHEEKAIPISRLQHVDLTRGPVERAFGLSTLVVFTAGTEGATFRVPGLSARRAESMRDQILRTKGHDVL